MDDLIFILERISINFPKNVCTDSRGNIGLSQLLKMFQGQVLGGQAGSTFTGKLSHMLVDWVGIRNMVPYGSFTFLSYCTISWIL